MRDITASDLIKDFQPISSQLQANAASMKAIDKVLKHYWESLAILHHQYEPLFADKHTKRHYEVATQPAAKVEAEIRAFLAKTNAVVSRIEFPIKSLVDLVNYNRTMDIKVRRREFERFVLDPYERAGFKVRCWFPGRIDSGKPQRLLSAFPETAWVYVGFTDSNQRITAKLTLQSELPF